MMKKIIFLCACIASVTFGFSQSVTVNSNQTDTAKTSTTQKKKLVRVKTVRANAVQTGPVIRTSGKENQSGTKQEENNTTPQ